METTPESSETSKNWKPYLLAGFIVSNLVGIMFSVFFFRSFWSVDPLDSEVSLVFIGTIFVATLMSSIASYLWSMGDISLRNIRLFSIPNLTGIWILYLLHPKLGDGWFFVSFASFTVVFCAFLGTWFGRRFFYE